MRFQRIFWVLLFLFPNFVIATSPNEAAIVAEQSSISAALKSQLATIESLPIVKEINPVAVKVETSAESFIGTTVKASTMCLESTSPALSSFVAENGFALQALGTMVKGMAGECSAIGKMTGVANLALGAFQAQCGAVQAICGSSAATLASTASEYAAASDQAAAYYSGLQSQGDVSAEPFVRASMRHAANAKLLVATSGKAAALCGKYKIQVMQAVTAGALATAEVLKSNKCNEKTASTGIDCSDPKNAYYNQKNCMCTRNELPAAECQNMTVGTGGGITSPAISLGGEGSAVIGDGGAGQVYGSKASISGEAPNGASGGAIPGAPVGGGSVGASGGSGGGAQDGSSTSRRLNTNILGGGFGGSGGGSSGSGPGYGQTDPSLNAYAPGGSKDATRSVAAEVAKQVTTPGSRSNWEKVRSRYTDHMRTLTGR